MKFTLFAGAIAVALAFSGAAEAKGHKGHHSHAHQHHEHHGHGGWIKSPKIYCYGTSVQCFRQ